MKEYITNLDEIKQLTQKRFDEFEVLRYTLEFTHALTDEELDTIVDEIAEPIVEAIDCTQCGNCCRSLPVHLTPNDLTRLSTGIDVSIHDIIIQPIDQKADAKENVFKSQPCVFLDGNICSVYEYRPESCRMYPQFTPDFRWIIGHLLGGASICPIIYNVLSDLVEKVEELW